MTRRLLHALALAACISAPAAAQDAPARDLRGLGVSAGSRVRVTAPAVSPEPMKGRVVDLTADSLLLARGGGARLQIDTREVQALAVGAGHARFAWALKGAAVGFLAGAILGAQAAGRGDDSGLGALVGFVAGAIVGTPLGAGIGAAAAPERWTPVRLPPPARN
ncbi:MAG TPA: hypothetical protein VM890_03925 [Longimicrobium sp.]|nr:hypothetical protein [Longimicrobium sp.]